MDKNSSRCRKFCSPNIFVRRKLCPPNFCPIRYVINFAPSQESAYFLAKLEGGDTYSTGAYKKACSVQATLDSMVFPFLPSPICHYLIGSKISEDKVRKNRIELLEKGPGDEVVYKHEIIWPKKLCFPSVAK